MWQKLTLTTADNTYRIAFSGRGSIYAEGAFGGGTIGVHVLHKDGTTGALTASTGFLDDTIDGATVKTKDVPSGQYELNLAGSTGASVDVYYNDQAGMVID